MPKNGKTPPRVTGIALCRNLHDGEPYIFAVLADGEWQDAQPFNLRFLLQAKEALLHWGYCAECAAKEKDERLRGVQRRDL